MGTSLWNVPSRVKRPQKSPKITAEERCQGEIDLDSLEKENQRTKNNSRTE